MPHGKLVRFTAHRRTLGVDGFCQRIPSCFPAGSPGGVSWTLILAQMGLIAAVSATFGQADTPLPPPRTLPPQTEQQAEPCTPRNNSRTGEVEKNGTDPTRQQLHQELERLRQERERLRQVRNQPVLPPPSIPSEPEVLHQRVQRLLMQIVLDGPGVGAESHETAGHKGRDGNPTATRTGSPSHANTAGQETKPGSSIQSAPDPGVEKPSDSSLPLSERAKAESASPPDKTSVKSSDKPLAPLELGQTLFRGGNYEAALAAFRLVETESLSREDRLLLQYLQATCLRKLGRQDDATMLLREIANSRTNAFAAECAQWQLSNLRWQQEMQRRLEQIRAWRHQRDQNK